jgi:CysZ protein
MAESHSLLKFPGGFSLIFRAGRLLWYNPRLLKYIAIPFLINVVVFTLAIFFGFEFFQYVLSRYLPEGSAWYWSVVQYGLWVVASLVTLVLVFFSFTVVGNLIAAPFNELLSERTEELLLGKSCEEAFSFGTFFRDMGRSWLTQLKKLTVFAVAMLILLLLNLLPFVGSLFYGILSFVLTLFFLGWEYLGYVQERKRASFKQQKQYLLQRKSLISGFSCGVLLLLAIPFLQLLCIPLAVIGATLLWCEDFAGHPLALRVDQKEGPVQRDNSAI